MIKNLIFDLDDTLVDCGVYYKQQQDKFAKYQHERTGLSETLIKRLREDIDVTFTQTPDGFNRVRFPRSFAATSTVIDIMLGNDIDEVAAYQSFELGDEVFNAMYPLVNGVEETLTEYRDAGHRLFLLTKGDFNVQSRKIELNQLSRWFDKERIYIVPQKKPEAMQRVIADHNLNLNETAVIGDSLRDDIAVAQKVGVTDIWISGRHNSAWAYENTQVSPTYRVENVTELPTLVDPKTGNFTVVSSQR